MSNGNWKFTDASGVPYINKWATIENLYANTSLGQQTFDWFFFDGESNMMTRWYKDAAGVIYYLNSASDGSRGKMVTNIIIDGKTLNINGEWVLNGAV